ncbi:phosphoesterase, partial [Streptomyces sp. SID8380]|nr:phosphoesterase [Streptomyces sp. SID8380]
MPRIVRVRPGAGQTHFGRRAQVVRGEAGRPGYVCAMTADVTSSPWRDRLTSLDSTVFRIAASHRWPG